MSNLFPSKKARVFFTRSTPLVVPVLTYLVFAFLKYAYWYEEVDTKPPPAGGLYWRLFGHPISFSTNFVLWVSTGVFFLFLWLFLIRYLFSKYFHSSTA